MVLLYRLPMHILLALLLAGSTATPSHAFSKKSADDLAWVQRPDGSLKCKPDTARSLEVDAKELELKNIKIYNQKKTTDHKMHAQLCGLPTGAVNAFQIRRSNLPLAVSAGFGDMPAKFVTSGSQGEGGIRLPEVIRKPNDRQDEFRTVESC